MIEIGKKDIIDKDPLLTKPFDRNCSFRAMNISNIDNRIFPYASFGKTLLTNSQASGLDIDLVDAGHINTIHPIRTFGFNEIPSALARVRGGRHVGEVFISSGHGKDV